MTQTQRQFVIQPLDTVKTRRQHWACSELIPLRVLTIFAGTGGIGKSTILSYYIAALTKGQLEGDLKGNPVNVALIASEDDSETTLVPRLQAAGADLARVSNISTVITTEENGTQWRGLPRITSDTETLKRVLIDIAAKVLVIDPVLSIMDGDSIKDTDVRRNLDPIASIANELDIAVILVMHFNKGKGNASDKLSGSHAFRDTARSVLLLAIDEETNQRILSVDKSNYSPSSPSYAFAIDTVDVSTSDGETSAIGRARPLGKSNITVHEIVNRDDDNALGELSSEIHSMIRNAATEVTSKDVADEFDISHDKARTYLGRLAKSGRIQRTGRGKYSANDTHSPDEKTVSNVSGVSKMDSNDTHHTQHTHIYNENICTVHQTPTLNGQCGRCLTKAVTS